MTTSRSSLTVATIAICFPALAAAQQLKPIVRVSDEPNVQGENLRTLTRTRQMRTWQPSDEVIVVEDLKERAAPRRERERESARGTDSRGRGAQSNQEAEPTPARGVQPKPILRDSVPAARQDRDLPEIISSKVIRPWQPGNPVRVVEDLKGRERSPNAFVDDRHNAESSSASGNLATLTADFDGIPATGFLPPDTVGDVGPNHYVQAVNSAFAIYDRTGGPPLVGPSPINSLWTGFGGPCETENNGDPIVNYDHLADRWLISQFALPPNNFHQCFAISQDADPTNGYFLYGFPTEDADGNPIFPDYPKISVWPDAYYMCTQRGFPNSGIDVWAFEREAMLNGNAARVVQFHLPGTSLLLMPCDLEGPEPPEGSPNYFARQVDGERFGGDDRIEIFAFEVDWDDPDASTFAQIATLPVDPFDSVLCSSGLLGACVPQPDTDRLLETLTVWPMWRLQYRNFGTHETLVFNHTIDVTGNDVAGIRWYELRRSGGDWNVFQQGDHGSADLHRWMGSAAMDDCGNLVVAYSVSSETEYPGIRYASRTPSDPPGTLNQGEVTLVTGSGSQTHSSRRWGNYSSLNMDPSDPTTFWYTTLYYSESSAAGWRTRVSGVRLPECKPPSQQLTYEYASKFVCGLQRDPQNRRLARGLYTTAVNIHNPNPESISFFAKLALTFPPKAPNPGKIIPLGDFKLTSDQALAIDCEVIESAVRESGLSTPYAKGFVIVQCRESLDVSAVYTSAALDENGRPTQQSSIDVEQIKERRLAAGPTGVPDLIPVPDENGQFCRRPSGDLLVTVRNQGTGDAAASTLTVDYGSHGRRDVAVPPLGPSDQVDVQVSIPVGCFDPDCDFKITVDSKNEIDESDESNNSASGLCLG